MTVGLVRDKHGYHELKKLGVADDQIRIGDITDRSTMAGVFDDASKVIMCTSARPKKKFWFRLINFLLKIVTQFSFIQTVYLTLIIKLLTKY